MNNEDLLDRTTQANVETDIVNIRWGMLGHIVRHSYTNITRQAITSNPQGKMKSGIAETAGDVISRQTAWKRGSAGNNVQIIAHDRIRWRIMADNNAPRGAMGATIVYLDRFSNSLSHSFYYALRSNVVHT